jgi:hypothetical protein
MGNLSTIKGSMVIVGTINFSHMQFVSSKDIEMTATLLRHQVLLFQAPFWLLPDWRRTH